MTIQSIRDSLFVILLQICRLEINSARDSIEILIHRDQLPQVTRHIRLPDTGSEGNVSTYPLGKDCARLAQDVISHLGRALPLLNTNASSAQMEVAAAIGVWRDARV
jgi:hypothetical protein